MEEFDETEYFEKEIEPLIKQIRKMCKEKNIPFVFASVLSHDKRQITQLTSAYFPDNRTPPTYHIGIGVMKSGFDFLDEMLSGDDMDYKDVH